MEWEQTKLEVERRQEAARVRAEIAALAQGAPAPGVGQDPSRRPQPMTVAQYQERHASR